MEYLDNYNRTTETNMESISGSLYDNTKKKNNGLFSHPITRGGIVLATEKTSFLNKMFIFF